jgi:hypothetical protein
VEILAMAGRAAEGAGLTTKEYRYNFFRADGKKSPGKVLLGGLAYYIVAKVDRIEVRVNRLPAQGSIVTIQARGLKGQQAMNLLITSLAQPNLTVAK